MCTLNATTLAFLGSRGIDGGPRGIRITGRLSSSRYVLIVRNLLVVPAQQSPEDVQGPTHLYYATTHYSQGGNSESSRGIFAQPGRFRHRNPLRRPRLGLWLTQVLLFFLAPCGHGFAPTVELTTALPEAQ